MPLKSRIPEIAKALEPAIHEAVKEAADTIRDAAKERVPVRTGRLRRAIHTEEAPEGAYVIAGDSQAWYGHLVEHGTSHSPPHPFLVPAFEENRREIQEHLAETIKATTE